MTRNVLVVSPHPDDESIGCGGTLRRHALAGDAVRVVFLTSGENGGHGAAKDDVQRVREAEAGRAAAVLGLAGVEFWRAPDGALRATPALVGRLAGRIAEVAADLVYVTHPGESHPDHRAAARIARAAVRRLAASAPDLLGFEVWTPLARLHVVEDVTPHLDAKVAAIRAYASQCSVLRFDEASVALARWRGEMYAWPKATPDAGRYAEVFTRIAP